MQEEKTTTSRFPTFSFIKIIQKEGKKYKEEG